MLRSQSPAVLLLIDIGALGDADQRVMRLEHLFFRKINVVGRDQRQFHRIGHFNKTALGQAFGLGQTLVTRMALQFDVEAIRENPLEAVQVGLRRRALTRLQQHPDRTLRTSAETDDTFGKFRKFL